MTNRCENQLLIRGPAEEIKRYKDSLLKAGDKYYLSAVPLPELKDKSDANAYIVSDSGKTLRALSYRVTNLEVIEKGSEELELHFETAYRPAKNLGEDLFPKLSILHKYFEAMNNFHGFAHYVKGKVIAQGHEVGEEQDSPWQMHDYNPWPVGVNPLEERLKDYMVIPWDQLRPMEELNEYLKKGDSNSRTDRV